MLFYRAVITWVVITGIYYIHTLHTHDDDSDMGAEGAGGSTQVVVGLGSRQPPDGYFVAGRQGGLRPPRRQVGLALVVVRGYFIITRLTGSWYLI